MHLKCWQDTSTVWTCWPPNRLRTEQNGAAVWQLFSKPTETGPFIGRSGLLPWTIDGKDEAEVAFALSKAYWGRGLATEVAQALVQYGFEHLQLPRLICVIERENQASISVATRIGMTFEKEGQDEKGSFLVYAINK